MTEPGVDFAIVAPVPLGHVQSGILVAEKEGFVAFGSMKWELLAKADERRHGQPVPVLIYSSHEDRPARPTFKVAWAGWYVGHVHSVGGAHREGMQYRPPTTAGSPSDNTGHWAVFWHVRGLRELPPERHLHISSLEGYQTGRPRKDHPPHGPELVRLDGAAQAAALWLGNAGTPVN